jgi:hypothetical protein
MEDEHRGERGAIDMLGSGAGDLSIFARLARTGMVLAIETLRG